MTEQANEEGVMGADKLDRLELWAPAEICAHLGVSRMTLSRWRRHWPDFPPPRWTVAGTIKVWDAAEVRDWHARAREDGRVHVPREELRPSVIQTR